MTADTDKPDLASPSPAGEDAVAETAAVSPEFDPPADGAEAPDTTMAATLVPEPSLDEPGEKAREETGDQTGSEAGDQTTAESGDSPDEDESSLRVKLDHFEGPLDLLLHLIRREKVDINDIPIAHITHQYLVMIETMQLLDLELAGEFLVMAATLMRIKSRTLLPPSPIEDEDEEGGDPRGELVRRLLEYRKYKEIAGHLRTQEETRSRQHAKGYTPRVSSDEPTPLKPISLFHLADVLRAVLSREQEQESVHEVEMPPVTVEECMEQVREVLAGGWGQVRFEEVLIGCRARIEVITMFIALLELIRLGEIVARQYEEFGEIWIFDPERLGIETRMTPSLSDEAGEDVPWGVSNPVAVEAASASAADPADASAADPTGDLVADPADDSAGEVADGPAAADDAHGANDANDAEDATVQAVERSDDQTSDDQAREESE